MAFLNEDKLSMLGFKYLGNNVLISDQASIYNPELISIDDNSRIDDFCVLSGKVTIGRNVHIAVFCNVAGGEMGVILEDFSGLAYGCQVFTQSDDYSGLTMTNPTVPDQYKEETKKPVTIGRHSIVGTSAIIFPGVCLSEGTAVGALSIVTKNTDEWAIYAGRPAKRIKARKRDLLQLEEEYLRVDSDS